MNMVLGRALKLIDITESKPDPFERTHHVISKIDGLIGNRYRQNPFTQGKEEVLLYSPETDVYLSYIVRFSGNSSDLSLSLTSARGLVDESVRKEEEFLRGELGSFCLPADKV